MLPEDGLLRQNAKAESAGASKHLVNARFSAVTAHLIAGLIDADDSCGDTAMYICSCHDNMLAHCVLPKTACLRSACEAESGFRGKFF